MVIANEDTTVGQLKHQHDEYMTGGNGQAIGTVQAVRVAKFAGPVTAVASGYYPASLPYDTVATGAINAKVYKESQMVMVASDHPTWFETKVKNALASAYSASFYTGTAYTSAYQTLSPYVDSMTLIQASILTGVKAF